MLGYIMFCQAWIFEVKYIMCLYKSIQAHWSMSLVTLTRVSLVLADIWNLHFFRFVTPGFCVSDRINDIHVHMLCFLTAIYPVVMIITAYMAIELYARDFRVLN